MKTLIILQNAWAKNKRDATLMAKNRRVWLYATSRSRSGTRLRVMLGNDCFENKSIHFDNTTPRVGLSADSKLPVDKSYLRGVLAAVEPTIVVACGIQAEIACDELWSGHLLCVPHPAHRLLTDELYKLAGELILNGEIGRLKLRQGKGRIERLSMCAEAV